MELYERIKLLRKERLKLTQEEFAERINISRSNLGNIETNRIGITQRVIDDICNAFNINSEWLRTGSGEMFIETKDDFMVTLAQRFDLDSVDTDILSMYFEMPSEYRKKFRTYLKAVVDSAYQDFKKENPDYVATSLVDPSIEKEIESYRRELELEKGATAKSSALPGAKEA